MFPKVPANLPITLVRATRAETDVALLKSRVRSLNSTDQDIRKWVKDLKRFERALSEIIKRCPGDEKSDCPILDALGAP